MSTLIVRDATLAINGAPEARKDLEEGLELRVREVSRMSREDLDACLDALLEGVDQDAPDIALALAIVGLAQPAVLEARGRSALATGRKAAACLERSGDPEGALALIVALRARHRGHGALDRDYEAIVRRMGMVRDLADRYLQRANHLLRSGKDEEAIGWLREVLVLEPGRKDVARRIRDLRLKSEGRVGRARVPRKLILAATLVPLLLAALVVGDLSVRERFEALPSGRRDDIASLEARLGALEAFARRFPVWSGAVRVLRERSELRVELAEARERAAVAEERRVLEQQEALELAESLRFRGRTAADEGHLSEAATFFRQALDAAPPDWEHGARLARDIEAIDAFLATESKGEKH